MAKIRFTVRVNRETLWLDGAALGRGQLAMSHGSLSEQCEGCGQDIFESGSIVKRDEIETRPPLNKSKYIVRCECGADYDVRDHGR